jgi:hypothetical protein
VRFKFCFDYLSIGHKTNLVPFLYTAINYTEVHNYTSVWIIIAATTKITYNSSENAENDWRYSSGVVCVLEH